MRVDGSPFPPDTSEKQKCVLARKPAMVLEPPAPAGSLHRAPLSPALPGTRFPSKPPVGRIWTSLGFEHTARCGCGPGSSVGNGFSSHTRRLCSSKGGRSHRAPGLSHARGPVALCSEFLLKEMLKRCVQAGHVGVRFASGDRAVATHSTSDAKRVAFFPQRPVLWQQQGVLRFTSFRH